MADTLVPLDEKKLGRPKKKKLPNQAALYQKIASHSDEIIRKLFVLLRSDDNKISLMATKILLDKILPDLKAHEITGANGEPIKLNIISGADYVSAIGQIVAASETGSFGRPPEIQSLGVASEGEEDNNGNQSDSEVVTA